jgi:hypothetical protein
MIELIASNGYLLEAREAYLELGKTYANSAEELKKYRLLSTGDTSFWTGRQQAKAS